MTELRSNSASSTFLGDDEIWWITGGYNDNLALDSTEVINVTQGGNFSRAAVNLPKEMSHHNLVNVNNTHMILLGGQLDDGEIYIIDR